VLWLWQLRDIVIIGIGCLVSVFALAQLGILLPIVATALYAFLTLLEADLNFLNRIQVQMATAREFLIIIRLKDEKQKEIFPYLNRIEKTLREQGFSVMRSGNEDIKRILAVYFEQNVTTEKFEDFDGERWVILGD